MVKEQVAAAYGVEVLRVAPEEGPAGPVYRVVIMNPGGNANGAFLVTTLVVDATSGELVPQFRHQRQGYELSAGGPGGNPEPRGWELRRESLRPQ